MYKMRKVSIFCLYLFVLHICCLVRPWGEGCLWLFCWFSFDEVWCSEAAKAGLSNSVQFLYLFVKFSDYRIAFGKIKSDNIFWKHRCFWYCARNGSSEPWKLKKKIFPFYLHFLLLRLASVYNSGKCKADAIIWMKLWPLIVWCLYNDKT